MLNRETSLKDILGWDSVNWSQALDYWDKFIPKEKRCELTALELGSGFNGGLSLWLTLKGIRTTCSGYHRKYVGASDEAKAIHRKYGVEGLMEYREIDATRIPDKAQYDVICYKSILGGIVRGKELDTAAKVVDGIHRALRPGGVLLFAENISSTVMHNIARRKFGSGKDNWRYFTIRELVELHDKFNSLDYQTFGFLGCFGLNEKQRSFIGRIDQLLFDKVVPEEWKYFIAGVAIK